MGTMSLNERIRPNAQAIRLELNRYEFLREFEETLKCSKQTLLAVASLLATLTFALGLGPRFFTDFLGTVPPVIATGRTIRDRSNRFDSSHWILYWVTFAALVTLESAAQQSLLEMFPFYYAFKLGFLVWCQSTTMRGSMFLYNHVLAPFLKRHECQIPAPT